MLDDNSDDGTALAAQAAAAEAGGTHHFRLLCGQPLPPGWMGKNWACHQLLPKLKQLQPLGEADILLFADADVFWQPGAVAAVVAEVQRSRADLLTVWPTQITLSWGERLTVPLMALAVLGYLPLRLAHDFYHPRRRCERPVHGFPRQAYTIIGGHASVRGFVVEDVRLAQRIKSLGLKLRMADGNQLIRCRMYEGWQAAVDGYAKNILAGHGNHVSLCCSPISPLDRLCLALGLAGGRRNLDPAWLAAVARTAHCAGRRCARHHRRRHPPAHRRRTPDAAFGRTHDLGRPALHWWRWRLAAWSGKEESCATHEHALAAQYAARDSHRRSRHRRASAPPFGWPPPAAALPSTNKMPPSAARWARSSRTASAGTPARR